MNAQETLRGEIAKLNQTIMRIEQTIQRLNEIHLRSQVVKEKYWQNDTGDV